MAGAGFKTFNTGDVLTAADVNTYLMQQTVMVFADSAARTTALGANVSEGMLSYLKDTNQVEVYNGSSWVASDDPNAIQNTIVDAKADLITATAADTPARLAVGTDGQVLTADSSTATGLKWSTAGSSDSYANVATFTASGTWNVPSNVSHCTVMVVGGGAGGGSGAAGTVSKTGGQGGSGGAIVISYGVPVTPSGTVTVTIGAGGTGGASRTTDTNGASGGTGNTTSFGTLVSAQGGIGGAGGSTAAITTQTGFTLDPAITFGTHIYDYTRRSLTYKDTNAVFNSAPSKMDRFVSQTGAAGSAGTNGTGGTSNGTAGGASLAGFAGGGGSGGAAFESTPIAYNGAAGNYGGGGGGGGSADSSPVGGAGGAGGANCGGGGGGGGVSAKNGTPLASGAGGNGGSGFVAIYY